ncbi:MAG: hypothetical protein ACI835_005298 [Planctomycetota bacterium]|jgi:hypothetical protein
MTTEPSICLRCPEVELVLDGNSTAKIEIFIVHRPPEVRSETGSRTH